MKYVLSLLSSLLISHDLSVAAEIQTIARHLQSGEEKREFYKKEILIKFPSVEAGSKWSLKSLSFDEWVKIISDRDWLTLKTFEQEDFYFAVFRSGNHLIFSKLNRIKSYSGQSTGLRAKDEAIRYDVTVKPSLWSTLSITKKHPNGSLTSQTTFTTWQLIDGFSGELILNCAVKNENEPYQEVFLENIEWTDLTKLNSKN